MKNLFKNKRILVAGGSGLVGTNLLIKLIELKSKVIASYKSRIQEIPELKFKLKNAFKQIMDLEKNNENSEIEKKN
jgi:FlaA1/EpsC-like NDP-sugar epimerase